MSYSFFVMRITRPFSQPYASINLMAYFSSIYILHVMSRDYFPILHFRGESFSYFGENFLSVTFNYCKGMSPKQEFPKTLKKFQYISFHSS